MEDIAKTDDKYKDFVIYKIYQTDNPDIIYIGSTLNFNRRKSQHKKSTINKRSKKYKTPLYKYIRGCGGFEKFNMELVEEYPCKTKREGLLREKELIEKFKAKLNVANPIK